MLQKGHPKLLNAWAFYDWANSVYSLVISSAIFPIFYGALTLVKNSDGEVINDQVEFLGYSFNNNALIGYITAFAFLIISVLSPLLSGIADYSGSKKFFMKLFCYVGAAACIGLYWFDLENLWFGLLCYLLGLIGFWGSIVFYNSYLPDIAFKNQQDKVSAKGFSLGYIGSVILLLVCLSMILGYEFFGFESEDMPTRLSFVLTGVWWITFSQYTFYHLPKPEAKGKMTSRLFFHGFKELKLIFKKVRESVALERYLVAYFVYSMAVQTIMLIATYFGVEEIDWAEGEATQGLIVSILLIQLVAILGAFLASRLAGKIGNIKVLIALNIIWVGICIYAFFMETPVEFYVAAFFVGLVMGGIQSLSRSTYSKFLPDNAVDTTSYFSFYDVSEKVGIVIGMIFYGVSAQLTSSLRYSIIYLAIFFIAGILLLLRVPRQKINHQT